jgi:hypothetical protein
LINPVAVIEAMERFPDARTMVLGVSLPWYYRQDERLDTTKRLMEVAEAVIASPVKGAISRSERLRQLSERWAGEANAERVFNAFTLLNEAKRERDLVGRYSTLYAATSMRHINRPLLLRPEVLSPAEEARFLPFIFNVSEGEARNDYADLHGGRIVRQWNDAAYPRFVAAATGAAEIFESIEKAPEQRWFRQLASSIRMWVSAMRSVNNFVQAQRIRDRRQEDIARGPLANYKGSSSAGDPDFFAWYRIVRDELDNTTELITLLNNGGLEQFARAKTAEQEDAFLFGPDVVETLVAKRLLMRKHWLDAQKYFAPPHI